MTRLPPSDPVASGLGPPAHRRGRHRMLWRILFGCAAVGLVAYAVVSSSSQLAAIPAILLELNPGWLLAAVAAQALSFLAFAREHQILLTRDGRRAPIPSVLATLIAGNVISVGVPFVGPPGAAAYTYHQYVRLGIRGTVATWTLAISGVTSTMTFVCVLGIGVLLSGVPMGGVLGVLTTALGLIPLIAILVALRSPVPRRHIAASAGRLSGWTNARFGLPRRAHSSALIAAIDQLATFRVGAVVGAKLALLGVVNWLLDAVCLACAIAAVHGVVPWNSLIVIWAAGSAASSAGITPAGLGVVETVLSAGLVAAGFTVGSAVAATLCYRFVKLWLVVLVGSTVMVRRHHQELRIHPNVEHTLTQPVPTGERNGV